MWLGLLNHHPLMRLVLGVHFAFFQGRVSSLALSIDTTLNTPFCRLTLVPIEAKWINSITPKGGGSVFPRDLEAYLAHRSQVPQQTPSSAWTLQTASNDP